MIPILRTEDEWAAAILEVELLWDVHLSPADKDYLAALGEAINDYEAQRWPIDGP